MISFYMFHSNIKRAISISPLLEMQLSLKIAYNVQHTVNSVKDNTGIMCDKIKRQLHKS